MSTQSERGGENAVTPDDLADTVVEALLPLGYEPNITCSDGSEPICSLDLGDGTNLDIYAKVASWCSCCDIDGTHHHERCDHPCCPDEEGK